MEFIPCPSVVTGHRVSVLHGIKEMAAGIEQTKSLQFNLALPRGDVPCAPSTWKCQFSAP